MRITFAIPTLASLAGGLRVVAQHAAHLRQAGHEVLLVQWMPPRRLGWRARLARLIGRGGPASSTAPRPFGTHFRDMGLAVAALPPDRAPRPEDLPDADLLVATWWETAEWIAPMPPAKGRQVHFVQDHEVFPYLDVARVQAVYRRPIPKIAVARWLAETMRRDYGQPARVVENGVDTARFDAPPRDRNTVLTCGMLYNPAPRKNADMGVAALIAARAAIPGLRAHLFSAQQPPEGLPDWISFEHRPAQDRIPQIYAACDFWLFPTLSEGFGLPLLEAMGCRTPLISTAAGAAPELVEGRTGWIVEPTVAAFADAIRRADAVSPADWRAMSEAARQMAERHDLARAAVRFEAALAEIAAAPA